MVGSPNVAAGMALDVVLLTSKEAGDFMQELTLGLREKGIASEVVAGAEHDTELIIDAMRRYRRGALYVLCRDGELDEEAADRLRKNLLHSRKVDEQHIVSILLRNKSMAGHANALATKAKLLGERQPPDATRGPGMGMGMMATLPKVRRKSADVDDDAKTTVARNPLIDDAATKVAPLPTARTPASYTPRAPPPPSTGTIQSKGPAKMPPMKKAEAPKPAAAVKKEDPATKISKPAQAVATPVAAPAPANPAPAPASPAPVPASLAPSPSPLVTPASAADFDEIEDIEPSTGPNKTALIAAAAALLALGVGAAVFMTVSGGEQELAAVDTKVGDKTPEEIIAETQAKLAEEKAIEASAQKEAEAAAAAAKEKADAQYAKEREEAAKTGEPEVPAAEGAEAEAAAAEGESGDEELAMEDEGAEAAAEVAPAATDEKAAIVAALKAKNLRSLDEVIVDPKRSRQGTYPDALAYCEGRESHGVKGWRVPEIGEISALVGARMVVKDYYWTTTPGDTSGNRQLVYDSRHGKIKSMSPKWKGGRVVCVRKREL